MFSRDDHKVAMTIEDRQRLTKRTIDALRPQAKRYVAWDPEISGFGCPSQWKAENHSF
jgi:hypothetical protein